MPATSTGTQPTNEQLRTLVHQLRDLAALRTYAQLLLRRLEADSSLRPLVEGMLSEQLGQYIDVLDGLGQQRLLNRTPWPHPVAPACRR